MYIWCQHVKWKKPSQHCLKCLLDEVKRLKAENFSLATHQCKYPTGNDYGHPQCLEINKLREALEYYADPYNHPWTTNVAKEVLKEG